MKEHRSPGWVVTGTILIAISLINKLFTFDNCMKTLYYIKPEEIDPPRCTYFNGVFYGSHPNNLYHFIGFNSFLILGIVFLLIYLVPRKKKK